MHCMSCSSVGQVGKGTQEHANVGLSKVVVAGSSADRVAGSSAERVAPLNRSVWSCLTMPALPAALVLQRTKCAATRAAASTARASTAMAMAAWTPAARPTVSARRRRVELAARSQRPGAEGRAPPSASNLQASLIQRTTPSCKCAARLARMATQVAPGRPAARTVSVAAVRCVLARRRAGLPLLF